MPPVCSATRACRPRSRGPPTRARSRPAGDAVRAGTKSTVTPSPWAGSESVPSRPLAHELLEQRPGEIAQVESRERRVAEVYEPSPSCQRWPRARARRGPASSSVASTRETVLALLRPPRQLVRPSGAPAAASASSSATARSTEPSGRSRPPPGGRSTLSTPPSITTVVPVTKSPAGRRGQRSSARPRRPCRAVRSGIVAATSSTRSP